MEVSLIPFLRKAVPRAAAALVASSLVVSCATSTNAPQATSGRNPSVAADVNLERVVLQAYRAIGDLANSDRIMQSCFWVGVYPGLTEEMLAWIAQSIRDLVTARRIAA